ncbi:YlxR family protein [Planosporangium sp. 12N6]|uniref:YlxR family protein n=1 Tax=Planosporangium spinosum TaxID=3402278 RepID=UPI003CF374AF
MPASELLRVVAIENGADRFSLAPDPARRRPGRGAHVHPDPACLALAERRRAFGRALRVSGVIDIGPLAEAVGAHPGPLGTTDGGSVPPHPDQQGRTTNMSTR